MTRKSKKKRRRWWRKKLAQWRRTLFVALFSYGLASVVLGGFWVLGAPGKALWILACFLLGTATLVTAIALVAPVLAKHGIGDAYSDHVRMRGQDPFIQDQIYRNAATRQDDD